MPTDFSFEVTALDAATSARLGTLRTGHEEVPTPVFMPVGTGGTVKALPHEWLEALDARVILANTYHLYLRPGPERIERLWQNVKKMRETRGAEIAVIHAHYALDDCYIGLRGIPGKACGHVVRPAHPLIEVPRRPSGHDPVQACVNEVRPGLEGLDNEASLPEGREDAEGHGRFTASAVRSCYDDAAHDRASSFSNAEFSSRERTATRI